MFLPALLLILLLFLIVRQLRKLEIPDLSNKAVFITGCDSGFGHGLALKCLSRGMPVFAGCLTQSAADSLRRESRNFPGLLETVIVDVANDDSVAKAKEILEEKTKAFGGLHGLVNNAGIVGSPFIDDLLTLDDYKKTAEVNVWGAVRVTHALKSLLKRARGRIVTVTSICARVSIPANGPYTVAKHAISAYCDTIRRELKPWGVSVHVLEPGFFKTPLTDPKRISAVVDQIWNRCSPELKNSFGREFVEESQAKMQKFLETISSDRVDLVVDAYYHALTARFPLVRYQVGADSKYLWRPLSHLPTRLQDLLFEFGESSMGAPVPAGLQMKHL